MIPGLSHQLAMTLNEGITLARHNRYAAVKLRKLHNKQRSRILDMPIFHVLEGIYGPDIPYVNDERKSQKL